MKYYTYYATNQTRIINQALFSILSLFQKDRIHERKDTKIIVFTDQPKAFTDFFKEGTEFLELIHLTPQDVNEIITIPGTDIKNIHRLKIKCIERIFEMHPGSKVMLMDSDTFLLESLQPYFDKLDSKTTYMHKDEGAIFEFTFKHGPLYHRKVLSQKLTVQGKPFAPNKDFHMYNAGVVGVSHELAPLFKEMVIMHDDIYKTTKYYNTEQFVLSHVLSTRTNLVTVDKVVLHYWYLKEFQATLEKFIDRNKNLSFKDLVNTKMPTDRMPTYEGFKNPFYNIPYKFKKKLFEKKLIKGPYVTFE